MSDFLQLYLSFNNFEIYQKHLLSRIYDFIDKIEIKNQNAQGFKLLKKKIDLIKENIEDDLKDENIKEIFKDPANLEGIEINKMTNYL